MNRYVLIFFITNLFVLVDCSLKNEERIIVEISQSGEYQVNGKEVLRENLENHLIESTSSYSLENLIVEVRPHPL